MVVRKRKRFVQYIRGLVGQLDLDRLERLISDGYTLSVLSGHGHSFKFGVADINRLHF
jgi:hypothetical protein